MKTIDYKSFVIEYEVIERNDLEVISNVRGVHTHNLNSELQLLNYDLELTEEVAPELIIEQEIGYDTGINVQSWIIYNDKIKKSFILTYILKRSKYMEELGELIQEQENRNAMSYSDSIAELM